MFLSSVKSFRIDKPILIHSVDTRTAAPSVENPCARWPFHLCECGCGFWDQRMLPPVDAQGHSTEGPDRHGCWGLNVDVWSADVATQ